MPNTTGSVTKSTFNKEVEEYKVREEFEVEPLSQLLTFDAVLVTSNVFDMDINGVATTQVPFNTDSNTTLDDIATEIATFAEIESAVRVGTDVIKIVPVANYGKTDFEPGADFADLDNYIVTAGASQAVVTATKVDSKVRPGMPVEQDATTGKVKPLSGNANLVYIGIALHSSIGSELVTVALTGFAVIVAESTESLNYGPVNWDSYDETAGRNQYNQTGVTATTFQGWALDDASGADQGIRVIVRG